VPQPEGPPPADLPQPDQTQAAPSPGQPGAPEGPEAGTADDPNVVATGLTLPWGLAVLPDGTALVGERTTGRLLVVQPQRAPVRAVRTMTGLDATGDGGLLGLALSPSFARDGLIYAYLTTRTDNRVVRFALTGAVTPVLTGIPKGKTGNGGRIGFGTDGLLYVGTGDAGQPVLSASRLSLAGKVLRVTAFGRPAPQNPDPASPIYSIGHGAIAGLCLNGADQVYTTEPASAGRDEINRVERGRDYGFPTSTTGKRMYALPLDGSGAVGTATPFLAGAYGRLRTVVAGTDGALWLTTSNKDGAGKPTAQDDRVIRILPPTGSTNSPA